MLFELVPNPPARLVTDQVLSPFGLITSQPVGIAEAASKFWLNGALVFPFNLTTASLPVCVQPFLVTATLYVPTVDALALGTLIFWLDEVNPFAPVHW